jgi:hypothetical protein
MTRKLRRVTIAHRLEDLETKTLLSVAGWQGYAQNAQHTALSPVAADSLQSISWQTPVDLDPQYTGGGDLLIHYGSPVITAANTVLVPTKTGATGGFEVQAFSGANGALKYTLPTDFALSPSHGGSSYGYDWTPSYSPTLTPGNALYFAGDGGTVYETTSPDASGPTAPAVTQLAFYGLSNYTANPAGFNSSVYINTPITSDAAGDIFFGYLVIGSTPLSTLTTSGVARISASGVGTFASVVSGVSQVATNSAPALSNDGSTLYVLESTGNFGTGKLVALNGQTLAVTGQVSLFDVQNPGNLADITNDATASPMVGPDGQVFIGVLESPFASNHDRGWLLQFNSTLTTEGIAGDFGWDDTPSVVPASMVPSYTGTSTYLLMTKYNNYAGEGGDGVNKVAILDPNASQKDPSTGVTVMKEILTIAGPTPDPEFDATKPNAVREWCINTAAVDPATDSVLVNSEDGNLYRWSLATNTFTQTINLNPGIGEAYTPTLIGPDGTVYAIGNAELEAVGGPAYNKASFVGKDSITQGTWIGAYGAQGYNVIGTTLVYPSYATVTPSGQSNVTWAASTTDPRALQTPSGQGRIAAAWYSPTSFSINVGINDGKVHDISLYLLDWDTNSRSEQIQLTNSNTGAVLDTEKVSSFSGGAYLEWAISGNVTIKISKLGGANAVLSGLFFDADPHPLPVTPPPPPPPPPGSGTATFVGTDTITQGTWMGAYGAQGSNVIGTTAAYPAYATVTPTGQSNVTWAASTSDPRALQVPPSGQSRIAAGWYSSTSFSVNVNITDGLTHDISLYLLDWDNNGRVEQIQLTSASNGTVLDTEKVSAFSGGTYLEWAISGNVVIKISKLGGANAVLSGLFFDADPHPLPITPPPPPPNPGTAKFVAKDTTTQGTWMTVYGTDGYNVINNAVHYPAYATVTPTGATAFTWVASTSDPRALQMAVGSSRIAAGWYAPSSFSVNVNVTDGQSHDIELYLLDWDGNNTRSEQIQLTSASTGTVLDTEKVSSFSNGVYLQWVISGNVVITVTKLGGPNIVLSGLFFDPPTGAPAVIAPASALSRSIGVQTSSIKLGGSSQVASALGTIEFGTIDTGALSPGDSTVSPTSALVHDVALENVGVKQKRPSATV